MRKYIQTAYRNACHTISPQYMLVIIIVKTKYIVFWIKLQILDLNILLVSDIKSSQIISSITKKMQQGITWCGNNLRDSLIAVSFRNNQATEMKIHFLSRETQSQTHHMVANTNSELKFIFIISKTTSKKRGNFLW